MRRHAALTPLLIRFGRIGDMVLQAPLLHLLRARYGRPCRLLSAGPWSSELFRAHPDVDEVWQLRARHRPLFTSTDQWRLVSALRRHEGPIYISEDVPRHIARIKNLLARADIAPDRCVFLSNQIDAQGHWVDRLLRFGRSTPAAIDGEKYTAAPEDFLLAPQLHVTAADRDDCRAWLRARGAEGRAVVLFQCGNKRATRWHLRRKADPKEWPEFCWAELLRAVRAELPNAHLLLCGASGETRTLARICASAACAANVATGELPLRRMLALMSIASSMVSVDTGPAHMAAAVGCPLVVIYGSESPTVWARRSPLRKPVIELGGPPESHSASAIAVDHVVAAWRALGTEPAGELWNHDLVAGLNRHCSAS